MGTFSIVRGLKGQPAIPRMQKQNLPDEAIWDMRLQLALGMASSIDDLKRTGYEFEG
jgi:hypothetical protein